MAASVPTVTLYRRLDCPLCDQARAALDALAPELDFTVTEVDIESDPALEREYRWAVPVVAIGDTEVLRAPIRGPRLREALVEALAAPG